MDTNYRNFYRCLYLATGGFLPVKPLSQHLYPGDFFQIRNGEMMVLGNVFRKGILDQSDCRFDRGVPLNPAAWDFGDGVSKPYSGRGSGQNAIEGQFEFSKQLLSFANKGSFFFRAQAPRSVKILNWADIQQQLIIKLTQTFYSFREIYVVTESVSAQAWTLAVADAEKAELEIATETENFGLVDIFGHADAKTIQSRDIGFYHREENEKPAFFRAKKLAVQEERLEVFISELLTAHQDRDEWASSFYNYNFGSPAYTPAIPEVAEASVLDMLHAGELNPNTALRYFRWASTNLDDVERLFLRYGNER